jgi:hypothetical protein
MAPASARVLAPASARVLVPASARVLVPASARVLAPASARVMAPASVGLAWSVPQSVMVYVSPVADAIEPAVMVKLMTLDVNGIPATPQLVTSSASWPYYILTNIRAAVPSRESVAREDYAAAGCHGAVQRQA